MDSPPSLSVQPVICTISDIFSELNTGLLFSHLADPGEVYGLTLVYGHDMASLYTGTDRSLLFGKTNA